MQNGSVWRESIFDECGRLEDQVFSPEILRNSSHCRFVEKGHRRGENVYSALGQTSAGRYLIVFFVRKKTGQASPISARDMTPSERKRYEKK